MGGIYGLGIDTRKVETVGEGLCSDFSVAS